MVTLQIQLDPQTLNVYSAGSTYPPVDPRDYPKIKDMMDEFVLRLESFGYVRAAMYTGEDLYDQRT